MGTALKKSYNGLMSYGSYAEIPALSNGGFERGKIAKIAENFTVEGLLQDLWATLYYPYTCTYRTCLQIYRAINIRMKPKLLAKF